VAGSLESRRVAGAVTSPAAGGGAKGDTWWQRSVRRDKDRPLWTRMVLAVIVGFLAVVLVRTFAFETFDMPATSMAATLQTGDRILVNKVVYDFRQPRRGEIVVFSGGPAWTPETDATLNPGVFARAARGFGSLIGLEHAGPHDYVRRVIGLPGDTVACCDSSGRVIVNGQGISEAYVTLNAPVDSPKGTPPCNTRRFPPTVVQPGYMFVLGDDRLLSQDSRCQGQVPLDNVVGQAIAIAWPVGHWSLLSTPGVFDDVPKPYSLGQVGRVPVDQHDLVSPDAAGGALAGLLTAAFGVTARTRGRRRTDDVRCSGD
jgi:signal peptidase I